MNVVPAGVHHADLVALVVDRLRLACVGQAGGLGDRKGVQICPDEHRRARSGIFQDADHAQLADAGRDLAAGLAQLVGNLLGGFHLLERYLGMRVQVAIEREQVFKV